MQDHLSTRVTLLEGRQAELAQQLEAAAAANEALTATNIALKQAAQEQVRSGCGVISVGGACCCCRCAASCMALDTRRRATNEAAAVKVASF
jgi:hypothetical protein